MSRPHVLRTRHLALLTAVVLATAPVTVLGADSTDGALPVPPEAVPGGRSILLAETAPATRDAYAGVGLLDAYSTCTAVLIRPGSGEPPVDAPAYALTNGHCVNLVDTATVLKDGPFPPGSTIRFGTDDAGQPLLTAEAVSVRWATMRGTDLAIVELADPLGDLLAQGVVAYPIGDPAGTGASVVVVGGPMTLDGSDRALRLAACTAGPAADLLERHWAWSAFPANDCADILPGSSGSPVFDAATGTLAGLINTTTQGSTGMSDCSMGRPCEVRAETVRSLEDTSYGPALGLLSGCFADDWTFTGPGGVCALDPGIGVLASSWTFASNPGATTVSGSWTSPSTWQADLQGTAGVSFMRTATGRAGEVDCHDPAAYGDPEAIPVGTLYDPPLPEGSGHWLLCVVGGPDAASDEGWQSFAHPTVLHTVIDRTPPLVDIEMTVHDVGEAWLVDPIFKSPELSMFDWKWGSEDATDCADPAGYTPYQVFPVDLPFADAPTRLCVIGYDDATNRSPALDQVLSAP